MAFVIGFAADRPASGQTFRTHSWSGGAAPGSPVNQQCLGGDFNGDGLMDIACHAGSGTWSVSLSSGSSFTTQSWASGVSPAVVGERCVTGDFDGNGMTDIACVASSSGVWDVALSSGAGFSTHSWGNGPAVSTPVGNQCVNGDFTGDGLTDIACYSGSGGNWATWLSTGSGFSTQIWISSVAPTSPVNQQCVPGDFNRDGRMDIACYGGSTGNWAVGLSTGSSFATQVWTSSLTPGTPIGNKCVPGDFNGDGSTDIACYTGSGGNWAVGLATGSVFASQFWSSSVAPTGFVNEQCATGDFNGDGLTDIACYTGSNGAWSIGLSTGTRYATQSWTSSVAPGFPVGAKCLNGEFNGDGMSDIACYTGSSGVWSLGMASPGAM